MDDCEKYTQQFRVSRGANVALGTITCDAPDDLTLAYQTLVAKEPPLLLILRAMIR